MREIRWLGDVQFQVSAVKRAFDITLGKMLQRAPSSQADREVPYLKSVSVQWSGVNADPNIRMWASPHDEVDLQVLNGDLMVCEGGDIGRCAIYDGPEGFIFEKSIHRVRSLGGNCPHYFRYVLEALHGSGWLDVLGDTATIRHLTGEKLGAVSIPLPSPDEQRRIAEFIDAETARIGRMVELDQQLIRLLSEREQALLDLCLEEISVGSGTVPLRRFIVRMDQGSSPQCDSVPAGDGEWGVLKVSCLRPGLFIPGNNKRLPSGVEPDICSEVKRGDLLITRANTPALVGSTAVVKEVRPGLLLSDKIFRVKVSADLDPEFVAVVAQGSRVRASSAATSNGASQSMVNLRFEEIKEWQIPAVSLLEQRRVVDLITRSQAAVMDLKSKVDRRLALLVERRQALITAAVTGQIDVTTARPVHDRNL